jgi:hypothetical protein
MKKCPKCLNDISLRKIRANFQCPFCHQELKSNELYIFGIGFALWWLVIGPTVSLFLSEFTFLRILIDLTLGVALLYFMFVYFLQIEAKE